jgi:hypothetical protein
VIEIRVAILVMAAFVSVAPSSVAAACGGLCPRACDRGRELATAAACGGELATAAACGGELATAAAKVAIVGATVIDGTGAAPVADAVIIVDGGRIAAVGSRANVPVPPGTREINAEGKYVIPGLMDANVHLVLGSSIEFIVRYEGRYEDLIAEAAQVTLRNGVTTVFDSWGPLQPLLNVRDRIKRGEAVGSRMFVAGNIVGLSGPFGRDFNAAAETTASKVLVKRINTIWEENVGPPLLYLTPEQIGIEIRKYAARGIDFLKYAATWRGRSPWRVPVPTPRSPICSSVSAISPHSISAACGTPMGRGSPHSDASSAVSTSCGRFIARPRTRSV